jgi:hypothetical protein
MLVCASACARARVCYGFADHRYRGPEVDVFALGVTLCTFSRSCRRGYFPLMLDARPCALQTLSILESTRFLTRKRASKGN